MPALARKASRIGSNVKLFSSVGDPTTRPRVWTRNEGRAYRAGEFLCGVGLGLVTAGCANFVLDYPEPVRMMWAHTKQNELAFKVFGKSLERGLLWDGAITEWQASITIPVYGEDGEGTVYGRFLRRDDGQWEPILVAANKNGHQYALFEKQGPLRSKADNDSNAQ